MRPLVHALMVALLVAALPAQASTPAVKPKSAPAATKSRLGELCPPGRWYVTGGNAARNAATANPPLVRRPSVAWRIPLPGTLCGEPLVWGEHVVVAFRTAPNRVSIEVRRLQDGSRFGRRPDLISTTDPSPCLWGNEVVWRIGESLELLRIGKQSLDFVTRLAAKSVESPVRLGTTTFAIVDGRLTALRTADFRVLWKSPQTTFAGQVAVGDRTAYGMLSVGGGRWAVAAFDRVTGEARGTCPDLAVNAPVAGQGRVQLAGATLFACFGSGHLFPEFRANVALNALELKLPLDPALAARPTALPFARALDDRIVVGAFGQPEGTQLGLFPNGSEQGVRLDTCELHRTLATVPPTIAGDVMYFGACAVDTHEYRMLWRLQRDGDQPLPMTRAIPAGRTLLLAGDKELVALREDAPADPVAAELTVAWLERERQRLTALVDAAMSALDWDLALDLLARCRELETDEAWAQRREKDIAQKRKDTKRPPDAGKVAIVRSSADAASGAVLDEVQQLVAGWQARPDGERRAGLRFLLDKVPEHGPTLAAVKALLPKQIAPPEPFLGRDWLDFLEATAHTKVTFLDANIGDFGKEGLDPITAQSKQQLLEWRGRWRRDLQALASPRLLLFSPVTQPGSLAKALATGELVCDALESMFKDMHVVRQDPRPMMVFIYPDRDEYDAESKKLGVDSTWTAGYYSDSLNETVAKSRMFVPADDTGFATVLPTLAHELTHHWLQDRCPAFRPDPVGSRLGPKAFWIVEGFASLVEQFEFDFVRRQFRFGKGDQQHADLVASAPAARLLDWNWLAKASRREFDALRVRPAAVGIASAVRLGSSFQVRGVNLFYAQAGMLARYLYDGEGGRFRQQLLDYVVAYYTGRVHALDFEQAFGVSAKDLGPKVVEYARAAVQ